MRGLQLGQSSDERRLNIPEPLRHLRARVKTTAAASVCRGGAAIGGRALRALAATPCLRLLKHRAQLRTRSDIGNLLDLQPDRARPLATLRPGRKERARGGGDEARV